MQGVGLYRVLKDDFLDMRTQASIATTIQATATLVHDDGTRGNLAIQFDTVANRSAVTSDRSPTVANKDGWVVGLRVDTPGVVVKRGTLWVNVAVRSETALGGNRTGLCTGYQHSERFLTLGIFEHNGPPDQGLKTYLTVADDVAPVDIEHTLSVANALRRVDGFIWYYHCSSDVATRNLRASARSLGNGLPTGMTEGLNTIAQLWPSAGALALTANQEGMILVTAQGGNSFAISLDNGSRVIEDVSVAQPLPFPYWATEDDVGEIFFDVTDEEAADRHSIYIIQEEWLQF